MKQTYTKYQIAKQLGLSPQAVHQWFNRTTFPSTENLFRLASLLNKTVEETVNMLKTGEYSG